MKSKRLTSVCIYILVLAAFGCTSDNNQRVDALETTVATLRRSEAIESLKYPVITKRWFTTEPWFLSHVQWFDGASYFERTFDTERNRDNPCWLSLDGVGVGSPLPIECVPLGP